MSLCIKIKTVEHKDQRYDTVGDWYYTSEGNLVINVSNLGDWRKEALIAVHELIECILCRERNISEEEVTDFDITFENNRKPGNKNEPGDDLNAPYHYEHQFASIIERAIALELGINWQEYEKSLNNL
jgi:hypothetical protein